MHAMSAHAVQQNMRRAATMRAALMLIVAARCLLMRAFRLRRYVICCLLLRRRCRAADTRRVLAVALRQEYILSRYARACAEHYTLFPTMRILQSLYFFIHFSRAAFL